MGGVSRDLRDILDISGSGTIPLMPTIFYIDSSMKDWYTDVDGKALPRDKYLPHGYGAVSAIDGDRVTLAHELGHLLGLAIGPPWLGGTIWEHYPGLSEHFLMTVGPDAEALPQDSSLRFSVRDEFWLFELKPEGRNGFETVKRFLAK